MIYIVNHVTGGYYTEIHSSYFLVESEAQADYDENMLNVGDDPSIVELVRVDLKTLEQVVLKSFEGTMDDLDKEEDEEDEEEEGS
jgi:hypothetical protein